MKIHFRTIIILLPLLVTITTQGQTYTVDAGHSSFQSKVIRFGVVPVVGRFTDVTGTITYNPDDLTTAGAQITIRTDSYTANNKYGEQSVKSDAFLNVEEFPEMRFELTSLIIESGSYVAKGMLELHGVKKEISCPVEIVGPSIDLPTKKQSVGIMGSLTIDRTAYGVGAEMKLPDGSIVIDNAVDIDFVILGIAE